MQPSRSSNSPNCTTAPPNSLPSIINEKQSHVTKRLEELNKWQESQRRLLQERQIRQRELLGLEQKSMYQMLGLRGRENAQPMRDDNEQYTEMNAAPSDDLRRNNAEDFIDAEEYTEEVLEEEDAYDDSVAKLGTHDAMNLLSSAYGQMANITLKNETHVKKPFLRKGEGLKQRFRIDPNEFRLNNLPRYKFANTHSRFALKSVLKKKPKEVPQNKVNAFPLMQTHSQPLDLHEQRFQEMLLTSKNAYNSTPELNNKFEMPVIAKNVRSRSPSPTVRQHNVHFNENTQNNIKIQENTCQQKEIAPAYEYNVAWNQTSNSQSPNAANNTNKFYSKTEDENIFELLEQKANEGSIDMNSPCIKEFMQRRLYEKLNNSDIEDIPVKTELLNKPLLPPVQDVATDTSSELFDADSESTEEEINVSKGTTNRTSVGDADAATTEVRVRFTDSNETHVFQQDESIEQATYQSVGEVNDNNEFLQQLKQALFGALKFKPDTSLNDQSKLSDTTLTPKESAIINAAIEKATSELQEKTELIKVRLAELEKEIQHFKDNNVLLMKARQQHELEKTLHAQEHLEVMEQVKDEKIKLEIYLHDERMKLEDEKRKFEQQIRGKAQAALAKERKEIEKLRQQCTQLECQLKSKEQSHMAAQARVRSQMRNLEKEQKKLHEEIDRLTKENKRLENENLRVSREQNNKLLQEINRNIAKLAPKQSSDDDHTGGGHHQRKTISKTILETSAANRMHRAVHKTHVVSPKKLSKSARGGCHKLGNVRKPKRLVAGFEIETETTLESSVSDESKDISLLNSQQEQQQQQEHDHRQQHQERKNYYLSQQSEQNLEYCDNQTDDIEDDDDDILEELDLVPKTQNNLNGVTRSVSPKPKEDKLFSLQSSSLRNESENITAKNTPPPVSASTELKREILNGDGSRNIWYSNGNLKKISPDGMIIRMLYYNKDIKETNINEGTVKYYYAETNTWHTTYLDGLEILEFPNGQIEHRHKNGLVEIHYPNQSVKIINPRDNQKLEEWRFADGTQLMHMRNGDRILMLANGQKEIHTKLNKRREYPDGTVKIVYPDGSQETHYSNGRIRLKDKNGNLVMDTEFEGTLAK